MSRPSFLASRALLLELLALIALIWGGLIAYASLKQPLSWSTELKQSSLRQFLFAPDSTAAVDSLGQPLANGQIQPLEQGLSQGVSSLPQVASSSTAQTTSPNPKYSPERYQLALKKAQQDSSSKFILLAGDSMTEQLRYAVEEYAAFNGHRVQTCIWYGSLTQGWSNTNRLAQLLDELKPSMIFFSLGGGEQYVLDANDRAKYVLDILEEAEQRGVPLVWLGTPAWKPDKGFGAMVQATVGKARYYSANHLNLARKSDGAHPTREASAQWCEAFSTWLRDSSYYQSDILWRKPQPDQAPRPYQNAAQDEQLPLRKQRVRIFLMNQNQVYTPPALAAKLTNDSLR